MLRVTSREAYRDLVTSGVCGDQKKRIFHYISARGNATIREVATALRMDTSAVSGRINEMKNDYVLAEGVRRKCKITKRTVIPVEIPREGQVDIF